MTVRYGVEVGFSLLSLEEGINCGISAARGRLEMLFQRRARFGLSVSHTPSHEYLDR